jgi:hypothetical protein
MKPRSINSVIDSIRNILESLGSPMAKFSSYSNLYILFRSIATVLVEQDVRLKEVIDNSFISTASGSNLDARAADFNIFRLRGTFTTGSCLVKGPATLIPKGTVLYSSDQLLQYEIYSDLKLTSLEAPSLIKALGIGEEYNLPQGSFLYSNLFPSHSFVIGRYRDPITKLPIGSLSHGSNKETDSEFRSRIRSLISGGFSNHGTPSSITQEITKLPFISRVFIKEHTPVTGYFTVFVDITDSQLIKEVDYLIRKIKPVGTAFLIRPLRTRPIDISIEIVLGGYSDSSITDRAKRVLSSYFSSLPLGSEVNPLYIRDALVAAIPMKSLSISKPSLPIQLSNESVADLGKVDISIRTGA